MSGPITHRFSIVVTCYNFGDYLDECLRSLTGQVYDPRDYEIVCVDDGSTDNTGSIIEKYRKVFRNLEALRIENSGLEKACNTGIRHARFDWIVRVDSDDALDPKFLSVMNQAMNQYPQFDFYYCKDYFEYYSGSERFRKSLPNFDVEEIFTRGDFFATGTVYRKTDLKEVGLFPEKIKNCGLENYTVVLALLSKGKRGFAVPETWFNYRRHQTNMSSLKREAIILFGRELLKRYGRDFITNTYHPYGLKLELEKSVHGKK